MAFMNNMIAFDVLNPGEVAMPDCSESQSSEIGVGFDAGGFGCESRNQVRNLSQI